MVGGGQGGRGRGRENKKREWEWEWEWEREFGRHGSSCSCNKLSDVLQAFWVLRIAGNKVQDLGEEIGSFGFGSPRVPSFDWL